MLLFWRIRYLDTRDREFRNRDLWLETNRLDPTRKAAVECCYELGPRGGNRDMLRFRRLFEEKSYSVEDMSDLVNRSGKTGSVFLVDYFEDEKGQELTREEMGPALTGDPNTVMLPRGANQHDIDFMLAPKHDVDLSRIQVPEVHFKTLAYFSRDLRELKASSFLIEGPGTVCAGPGPEPAVKTAVSDDEIRSFVTIFRRLYMANEPGNFVQAAAAFARALACHPIGKWVQGVAAEYERALDGTPDLILFARKEHVSFTRKRLIDAFIYTQYAHQGDERRERQYADCLAQVDGKRQVLFWLFLAAIWESALHIHNAGVQIASFTEHYCRCHGLTPAAVGPAAEYVGMGQLEKRGEREARIFREKAEELAMGLWQNAGRPEGGPAQFLHQAREQLRKAMGDPGRAGDPP